MLNYMWACHIFIMHYTTCDMCSNQLDGLRLGQDAEGEMPRQM
jgi:hypothetical protein